MKIQEVTRRLIIDELIMIGCVPGQMNVSDFVRRVFPKAMEMGTTDHRFEMKTAIDDIHQHMDNNNDWDYEYLFCDYLDLLHVEDDEFIYFLEQYVHPMIRRYDITEDLERVEFGNECVEAINKHILHDGLILAPKEMIAGKEVYAVESMNLGVQGSIKNIIFAADYKPEIVLDDALNNDIKVIANQDKCLIYDKKVPSEGILWCELQEWYDEKLYILDTGLDLRERLRKSLNSVPEKLFYDAYMEIAEKMKGKVPALFPQVYLYYDPKLERERIKKIFEHQRMDFLMIFSETHRVVIEIDGIQHYSEVDSETNINRASVDKYAEMVSAQRDMCLAGYDVYRFGGKELYNENIGKNLVKKFFKALFEKYKIE